MVLDNYIKFLLYVIPLLYFFLNAFIHKIIKKPVSTEINPLFQPLNLILFLTLNCISSLALVESMFNLIIDFVLTITFILLHIAFYEAGHNESIPIFGYWLIIIFNYYTVICKLFNMCLVK